jgi:hypothetical protein
LFFLGAFGAFVLSHPFPGLKADHTAERLSVA